MADSSKSRRMKRGSPPPRTDAQSGHGYRGVGSYDSYGNKISGSDTLEISYPTHPSGAQFKHKMGGRLPAKKKRGLPYDFPRS